MATNVNNNHCTICKKEGFLSKCRECSKLFCYSHLVDHRDELRKQLDEIGSTCDLLRQSLVEQRFQLQNQSSIQQIEQWERHSINKIRQTAEEAKQLILRSTTTHIAEIQRQLDKLTDQLRQTSRNDNCGIDLSQWKLELAKLTEALYKPPNFYAIEDSTPLVTNIIAKVQRGMYLRITVVLIVTM
ncbi:unnamed protein product [Rotaria sp. Silwood1]|nr:unnamed protein product [Rotaria sp. Silwood1]